MNGNNRKVGGQKLKSVIMKTSKYEISEKCYPTTIDLRSCDQVVFGLEVGPSWTWQWGDRGEW